MKRTFLKLFSCSVLVLGMATACAQEVTNEKVLNTKIDNYLSAGVPNGFSGAILVAKEGKVIINKGYGMANKEQQKLNTPTTIFDIGSNTKQFTGAAILKLTALYELKLTDPIKAFFNNLPNDKKDITVHQLLTHSAGFIESIGSDFDEITRDEFFEQLFASELINKPGSTYSYSNVGYSILARIIELVSGKDYETFLNENLFKPAGMTQTGYLIPDWNKSDLATGYARNVMPRGPMVNLYKEEGKVSWHLKGNGGINSTQEDMYKWFKALKSNAILTKSQFETYTNSYIGPKSGTYGVGYGWGIKTTDRQTKRMSHNGSNGAYDHSLIYYPEEDILIIYACNASSPKVESLGTEVDKMIFDNKYHAEPIKKNPYFFLFDFIEHNDSKASKELLTLIKNEYSADFDNPNVLNRVGHMVKRANNDLNWALALFEINVGLFAEDGNAWDSLGEVYALIDRKDDAITSYKKAMALGYQESANKIEELLKKD